jgi:hypothetical protein
MNISGVIRALTLGNDTGFGNFTVQNYTGKDPSQEWIIQDANNTINFGVNV